VIVEPEITLALASFDVNRLNYILQQYSTRDCSNNGERFQIAQEDPAVLIFYFVFVFSPPLFFH